MKNAADKNADTALRADKGGAVPALRFPEFANAGAWQEKELSSITKLQNGFAFKSHLFGNGYNKVIRIGDVVPRISIKSECAVITSEQPSDNFCVKKDDFLIALSGATFGKIGRVIEEGQAYINQRVAAFKTIAYREFVYQLVQTSSFRNYLDSIPTAGAQPNISTSDILKFRTWLPSLSEQQKIADCLSRADEIIAACEQKLEEP